MIIISHLLILQMMLNNDILNELLLNSSPEGLVITDKTGKILKVNASLVKMFGYENEQELLDKQIEVLIPERFKKNHSHNRETYNKNPSKRLMSNNLELFGMKKNGKEFPLEIGLNYVNDANGIFISALVTDITERVKIEKQLKQLNQNLEHKVEERTQELENAILELQHSNKNLEYQVTRTQKAEEDAKSALEKEKKLGELKSRFVSMASHEFRTPLSSILSSNSIIIKYIDKYITLPEEKEKIFKHTERIEGSVKNLTEILNDFLSLGKLEEGIIKAKNEIINLSEIIELVVEETSPNLKNGQKVAINCKKPTIINSDAHLLKNILINLISNAIKYSEENKTITVDVKEIDNVIKINIIDQGIGIPSDDKEHMFERFFRAQNTTNIQGTGLGLNIVKKYVELLKGDITFESTLSEGSTFILTLKK